MADHKTNAIAFLTMASSGSVDEAFREFVSADFKHHNAFFAGTTEALKEGMKANAKQNPAKVIEVKRAIVEGEFVVTHSHVQPNLDALGAAVVHIFRFENGKIAELWDVAQPIIENSPNSYGIF